MVADSDLTSGCARKRRRSVQESSSLPARQVRCTAAKGSTGFFSLGKRQAYGNRENLPGLGRSRPAGTHLAGVGRAGQDILSRTVCEGPIGSKTPEESPGSATGNNSTPRAAAAR